MLPLYVRNILHLGADRLGILMAISGTGALAGSLGLLTIKRENRLKFMSGNAIAVATALFCMSQAVNFWITALSMGLLAIGLSVNFGLANTIVQERAPAHLRGRISAVFGISFFGLMPIAGLLIPGVSDLIGMRTALGVAAIAFGLGASFILRSAGREVCQAPDVPAADAEAEAQPAPAVIP
jgi:MFS family permease